MTGCRDDPSRESSGFPSKVKPQDSELRTQKLTFQWRNNLPSPAPSLNPKYDVVLNMIQTQPGAASAFVYSCWLCCVEGERLVKISLDVTFTPVNSPFSTVFVQTRVGVCAKRIPERQIKTKLIIDRAHAALRC